MNHREETLSLRGRHIRLLRGGAGQPLLYLHDTYSDAWSSLHDRLAQRYDVVFPIHPGCVGSEGFDETDTMEDLVFHYLDVCEALHLERPLLLGASLGGWLAAELAVRYAGMLRGLILVDALGLRVAGSTTADILRLDAAQTRAAIFAEPDSALAQELVPDVPTPEALPVLLQARRTLARFAWQFPDNPKLARYLYRVTLPTLIIWGEEDAFVPVAHGRAYQDGIAGAELAVLPRCGHLPHIEQPEACAQTMMDFLIRRNI